MKQARDPYAKVVFPKERPLKLHPRDSFCHLHAIMQRASRWACSKHVVPAGTFARAGSSESLH